MTEADATTDPYLAPDATARQMARRLARTSAHGVLSCLEADSGDPIASRVALGHTAEGDLVILVSALSLHTRALARDGRCAVLVGEPGRGDPLAHPRLMARARAEALREEETAAVRARFLERQSKAALYADFPDFRFLRLRISGGLLNAGFAKAYRLDRPDLTHPVPDALAAVADRVRSHMNEDHGDALDAILARHGETGAGWRIATLDPLGFEARREKQLCRVEFRQAVQEPSGYREAFVALARDAEAAA